MNTNRLIHLSPQTSNVNLSCVSLCVSEFTPHYQKMLTLSHDTYGINNGMAERTLKFKKKKKSIYKCIEVQM